MDDDKGPLIKTHIRNANLWAIAIITFAVLLAAANYATSVSHRVSSVAGEIDMATVKP